MQARFPLSLFVLLIPMFISGCKQEPPIDPYYSFYFAGHLYGSPPGEYKGAYPPFMEKKELIQNWPGMQFGLTGGDNTRHSYVEEWDSLTSNLDEIGFPVYYTAGNHDHKDIDNFLEHIWLGLR